MRTKKINSKKAILVRNTAHDSWSGPESYILTFDSLTKAKNYVKKINGKNTSPTAPSYYETAEIIQS